MTKPILTHPSWTDIEKGCAWIAMQILKHNFVPETIVALKRGGSIPATIIAHMFDIDKDNIVHVSYSSKNGSKGDGKSAYNFLPRVYTQNVLVVDDIVDSGWTMNEVVGIYKPNHNVLSAVLYYKTGSVYKPDFTWQEIPDDAPWIIYPWG